MHQRSTLVSPASLAEASADKAPLLVCFSHLRWDFVWQRPQHLLSRAAKHYRVLVIEEPVYGDGIAPTMDISRRPGPVTIAVPKLPTGLSEADVILAQRTLIEKLIGREAREPRVFWYYTPMAMAFSSQLECDLCVYDNMDELSLFNGASPELLELEADLFVRSDVVFTGGMSLYEAKRSRHHNVHAFPSSIEFDHFVQARRFAGVEPADQAGIPHPRLGFFGVVDERMDVELLGEVAALRPDWHFVMLGPVMKIDEAVLPRGHNIHWLGSKSYKELPRYLASWDVGFMPFALNEATRYISPTKTPEFLAAGVPVVSTAITDVIRPYGDKGFVEIVRSAQEVVAKSEALLARPKEPWLARVDRHLAAGSWDKTWGSMQKLMSNLMDGTASERPTLPGYVSTTPAE